MTRSNLTIVLAACALTALTTFAQAPVDQPATTPAASAVPVDQRPTREQLARLFKLMRLHEQLQSFMKMMPTMMQQQVQAQAQEMSSKLPGGHVLTPDQQAAIDKVTERYMQKALNIYPTEEMLDDMVAIYQRHLTRSDIDAFIAFYSSPAGQHLLNEQPAIMQEYMPIAMKRAQDRTKALTDDLTGELRAIIKSAAPDGQPAK